MQLNMGWEAGMRHRIKANPPVTHLWQCQPGPQDCFLLNCSAFCVFISWLCTPLELAFRDVHVCGPHWTYMRSLMMRLISPFTYVACFTLETDFLACTIILLWSFLVKSLLRRVLVLSWEAQFLGMTWECVVLVFTAENLSVVPWCRYRYI